MATAADIVDLILGLPATPFAQLAAADNGLALACDGRELARVAVADTAHDVSWSANHLVNQLAHGALFASGIGALPAGEAVNTAHQVIEWWDAAVCAIANLNRRSRGAGSEDSRTDRSA